MKNKYSISSILCDRSSTSTFLKPISSNIRGRTLYLNSLFTNINAKVLILSRVSIKYLNSYIQELASMAPLLVPRLLFTILFIIKGSLLLNLI